MHEWAHYRWGIFDEYGHPEDPKYPVSYEDELGDREVTACYERELTGDFLTMLVPASGFFRVISCLSWLSICPSSFKDDNFAEKTLKGLIVFRISLVNREY